MKALIFAAGKGTRLKPFTDNHPKALAKVNGIPLLERNIKYLQSFGINDFVINIHHFGDQIIDFLNSKNNFGANIDISDERKELLETGGGLLFAKDFLKDEDFFLVMNADILTDMDIKKFINFHKSQEKSISLAVSNRESSRKLLFNDEMILKGWKNINTNEIKICGDETEIIKELSFSGIHCINFGFIEKIKRRGKFSIIDEYLDWMKSEQIIGYQHNAKLIDVGKPESIEKAEKLFY